MRQVIYYPTFELRNEEWLKFALLYFDKLDTIVPYAGDIHLSDGFRRLMDTADLIRLHRPDTIEGASATIDAIEHAGKILRHPERYEGVFETPNVVDVWKTPEKQTFTLFKDKYTRDWERFCLKVKLARKTVRGVAVAEDLALLYMTLLAHIIGDGRGIPPITDHPALDRIAILTRTTDPTEAAATATAQAVIKLYLPANLRELSVEAVLRHRLSPGFLKLQKAFHRMSERRRARLSKLLQQEKCRKLSRRRVRGTHRSRAADAAQALATAPLPEVRSRKPTAERLTDGSRRKLKSS